MSEKVNYWESIISEYKASGLSQPAFCKQNGLSCNQFQYRRYQHNLAKRAKQTSSPFADVMAGSFESITIAQAPVKDEVNYMTDLAIHLPNKIRCDVKMDFRNNAFVALLKQLVALC